MVVILGADSVIVIAGAVVVVVDSVLVAGDTVMIVDLAGMIGEVIETAEADVVASLVSVMVVIEVAVELLEKF